ncbi:MAG: UvrD-helicase domain-containing protein [Candidatus Cloacimonas sp.]|nr:UvrD-helicase domain-containing protein [Candidatus Cloacimonadota bacterium]
MFLNELDPQQKEVVLTTEGPLLVFAGAGSGKTRSIIYRAAHLINNVGVLPWKILIVTFTNKASSELKERLSIYSNIHHRSLWVGTFHSICSTILRVEAKEHDLQFTSNFTIFDTEDQKSLIKKILKELDISTQNFPIGSVISIISRTKNSLITPDTFFEYHPENMYTQTVYAIYTRYQERLLENNALDFDDLLMKTALLLRENEQVRNKYQDKFSHIMIDEYQDTNYAQFKIISTLAEKSKNICAVGDDDQAIYSWRGASIKNILNFTTDFPNAKIIRLERNYRSSQPILDAANKLICNNKQRHPKTLWSDKDKGDAPLLNVSEMDVDEARAVLSDVELLLKNCAKDESIAILYRTNAQSRLFETICVEMGIPYRIFGSVNFFQRKEIKDIVAYLRVIVNPADTESLLRIINFPPRGIGAITLDKIFQYCHYKELTLFEGLREVDQIDNLSGRQINAVTSFVTNMIKWQKMSESDDLTSVLDDIYKTLGLLDYYADSKDYKDITRSENIKEFLAAAKEFADNYLKENNEEATLTDFLQNIALFTTLDNDTFDDESPEDKETNKVNLMTLHIAKGLEFDNVFVVGLEEKLLPHQLSLESSEELEEERRLLYVGMTRAKSRLVLSYAKYRRTFYGYELSMPSRFLKEIFPDFSERTFQRKSPYTSSGHNPNIRQKTDVITESKKAFKIGQKVKHSEFGQGVILSVNGVGRDAKLIISFSDGKLKNIIGSYVQVLPD